MKTSTLIIIVLLLGGAAGLLYYFVIRKKDQETEAVPAVTTPTPTQTQTYQPEQAISTTAVQQQVASQAAVQDKPIVYTQTAPEQVPAYTASKAQVQSQSTYDTVKKLAEDDAYGMGGRGLGETSSVVSERASPTPDGMMYQIAESVQRLDAMKARFQKTYPDMDAEQVLQAYSDPSPEQCQDIAAIPGLAGLVHAQHDIEIAVSMKEAADAGNLPSYMVENFNEIAAQRAARAPIDDAMSRARNASLPVDQRRAAIVELGYTADQAKRAIFSGGMVMVPDKYGNFENLAPPGGWGAYEAAYV